jgi:hypothetical protein
LRDFENTDLDGRRRYLIESDLAAYFNIATECTCHQLLAAIVSYDIEKYGEQTCFDYDVLKFDVERWPDLGRLFGAFKWVGKPEV